MKATIQGCILSLAVTSSLCIGSRIPEPQGKYAAMRPFPVGVVFIYDPRRHKTMADIKAEFVRIKQAGFTCLKQVMLNNITDSFVAEVFDTALDTGLIPWWYDIGGWDEITPQLLLKLGLPYNMSMEDAENSPAMVDYQTKFLRKRVANMSTIPPYTPPAPKGPGLTVLPMDSGLVPFFAAWLQDEYDGNVEALNRAWHVDTTESLSRASRAAIEMQAHGRQAIDVASVAGGYGLASAASASYSDYQPKQTVSSPLRNFTEAALSVAVPTGGAAPSPGQWAFEYLGSNFHFSPWQPSGWDRDYRRFRDAMRFHAQHKAGLELDMCRYMRAHEPQQPVRVGGETMLLQPQPLNGWDRALMADVARECGAYYDSLHLPWHYALTNTERSEGQHQGFHRYDPDQSLYSMARYIADGGRDMWRGAFESSGGPALYSGAQDSGIDGGQIQRMFINYLSAGLRGIGVWSWNARWQGQEAGGYALTDLQGNVGGRAIAAGNVSKAIQRERFSLWEAEDEPVVAVLHSWEAEAANSRMGQAGGPVISCTLAGCRDRWAQEAWLHVKARLGVAAALTAAGVPWQWVSDDDLGQWGAEGLIQRGFRSVVLPGLVSTNSTSVLPVLLGFVAKGGTVVADAPLGLLEAPGSELVDHFRASSGSSTDPAWADLFGAGVSNWQSSSNGNERIVSELPGRLGRPSADLDSDSDSGGLLVQGTTADLLVDASAPGGGATLVVEPGHGQPNARPWASAAVWDRPEGGGRTVLLGFEAGRLAFAEPAPASSELWPDAVGSGAAHPVPPMSGLGPWGRFLAECSTRNYTLLPGAGAGTGAGSTPGLGAWRVTRGGGGGSNSAVAGAFGPGQPMVQVPGLKVFRRSAPGRGVDYFFFLNSKRTDVAADLLVGGSVYRGVLDALSHDAVHCSPEGQLDRCSIQVPAHGARWLIGQLA